jgi:hypothetical protein
MDQFYKVLKSELFLELESKRGLILQLPLFSLVLIPDDLRLYIFEIKIALNQLYQG